VTVLTFVIGLLVIVVGLAISIALHEVGHLVPAKLFGVRVGRYMIGLGPTLWSRKFGETAVERARRLAVEEMRREVNPLTERIATIEKAEKERAVATHKAAARAEQEKIDAIATGFVGTTEKPGKYARANVNDIVRRGIDEIREGLDRGAFSLDDVPRLLPQVFERHAKASHEASQAAYAAWKETERAKEAAEARGKLGARRGGTGKNATPVPEKGEKPSDKTRRLALWAERARVR